MENKESYTPKEVAEMCRSYSSVDVGFGGPVHAVIMEYEKTVPKNVRDVINQLSSLEEKAFREAGPFINVPHPVHCYLRGC